jgi:hypothetical protein
LIELRGKTCAWVFAADQAGPPRLVHVGAPLNGAISADDLAAVTAHIAR